MKRKYLIVKTPEIGDAVLTPWGYGKVVGLDPINNEQDFKYAEVLVQCISSCGQNPSNYPKMMELGSLIYISEEDYNLQLKDEGVCTICWGRGRLTMEEDHQGNLCEAYDIDCTGCDGKGDLNK